MYIYVTTPTQRSDSLESKVTWQISYGSIRARQLLIITYLKSESDVSAVVAVGAGN